MPLTILQVAYSLARVGSGSLGGAEQVLSMLDRAWTRRGHSSIVLAGAGSQTAGELVTIPPLRHPLEDNQLRAQKWVQTALLAVLTQRKIDVIHFHGLDFLDVLPVGLRRCLASLHMSPEAYGNRLFAEEHGVGLVCVSATERASCPDHPGFLPVIANGIELDQLRYSAQKGDFALVLGRICPEKAQHLAILACKRAGVPLLLAGGVFGFSEHERYFREQIEPLLDDQVRYIGPVEAEQRRELLAEARCLLLPSMSEETSSLVTMEAMASGTPVIAFARPVLAEILEHGRTGLLVDSWEEMSRAIEDVGRIAPAECREQAHARFDSERMADRYLETYEDIVAQLARPESLRVLPAVGSLRRAPVVAAGLELQCCEASEEIEELMPQWLDLWEHSSGATVFQHPLWLKSWYEAYEQPPARVFALWKKRQLVGILPLVFCEDDGQRKLGAWGAEVSDEQDLLLRDDQGREAAALVLEQVFSGDHIELVLEPLPPGSALLQASSPRFGASIEHAATATRVSLPADFQRFELSAHEGLRRAARYSRRSCARQGIELRPADSEAEACKMLGELVRLHAQRWRARGQEGALFDSRVLTFHGSAVPRLHAAGLLRMSALVQGERTIAVSYGLRWKDRAAVYLTGFDPVYKGFSPGTVLLWSLIEQSIADGCRSIEFLRGKEPYKYAYGAKERACMRLRIKPAEAWGRADSQIPRFHDLVAVAQ